MMLDWLVARPIAHRGWHDAARAIVENSRASAAAAIERHYAIECDVQLSADGEAMVFHDFTLDRLSHETGRVAERPARALAQIQLKGSADCIPDLASWLSGIAGAVPVICEIKSSFDGDLRLATRTASLAAAYGGRMALKSFDPAVIAALRQDGARLGIGHVPLGLVAEARFEGAEWAMLSPAQRLDMAALTHWERAQPDFLSWHVEDLPHAAPSLCRAFGVPVMAWTVRTPAQQARAAAHADQMVFEGFAP